MKYSFGDIFRRKFATVNTDEDEAPRTNRVTIIQNSAVSSSDESSSSSSDYFSMPTSNNNSVLGIAAADMELYSSGKPSRSAKKDPSALQMRPTDFIIAEEDDSKRSRSSQPQSPENTKVVRGLANLRQRGIDSARRRIAAAVQDGQRRGGGANARGEKRRVQRRRRRQSEVAMLFARRVVVVVVCVRRRRARSEQTPHDRARRARQRVHVHRVRVVHDQPRAARVARLVLLLSGSSADEKGRVRVHRRDQPSELRRVRVTVGLERTRAFYV